MEILENRCWCLSQAIMWPIQWLRLGNNGGPPHYDYLTISVSQVNCLVSAVLKSPATYCTLPIYIHDQGDVCQPRYKHCVLKLSGAPTRALFGTSVQTELAKMSSSLRREREGFLAFQLCLCLNPVRSMDSLCTCVPYFNLVLWTVRL